MVKGFHRDLYRNYCTQVNTINLAQNQDFFTFSVSCPSSNFGENEINNINKL